MGGGVGGKGCIVGVHAGEGAGDGLVRLEAYPRLAGIPRQLSDDLS